MVQLQVRPPVFGKREWGVREKVFVRRICRGRFLRESAAGAAVD